ncbi:MAG: hypothetical protein FWD31_13010, partial [Planctomycetaceae bacterium]|nr:hypothetical protein [Planctomycetaceae bacterium]
MKPRLLYLCLPLLLFFMLPNKAVFAEEPLIVYTSGHALRVITADGQDVLRLEYAIWGPEWAWTGVEGSYRTEGETILGEFNGRIGRSNVPFTLHTQLTTSGKRQLRLQGEFKTSGDTGLTMACLALAFDAPLRGRDRASYTDATGTKTISIPLGLGTLTDSFKKIDVKDVDGKVYSITFDQPITANHDNGIRFTFAEEQIKADAVKAFAMTLDLPEDSAFYLTPAAIPNPPDWDQWFPWTADADVTKPSVIDASGLLDAPAGKHGRVLSEGDQLIYNGKPIKFWGLNTCYEAIASPKDVSEQRAAFYAKYGVNAVRLHKFADGPDWDGVLDRNSYTRYNPEKL